jgi:hypothetical protein
MKLKQDLTQMVQSDYVPLSTTSEGALRGGFGSVPTANFLEISNNNAFCKNPKCSNETCANPTCANGECANPLCSNAGCTVTNNCSCSVTTTTPAPAESATGFEVLLGL